MMDPRLARDLANHCDSEATRAIERVLQAVDAQGLIAGIMLHTGTKLIERAVTLSIALGRVESGAEPTPDVMPTKAEALVALRDMYRAVGACSAEPGKMDAAQHAFIQELVGMPLTRVNSSGQIETPA